MSESLNFPNILDPTKTYYPPDLFEREIKVDDEWTRYERLDEADVPLVMARFAILHYLKLPGDETTHMKIARSETSRESFMADIRKIQFNTYEGYEGMSKGDIELAAVELQVYDLVFPPAPPSKKLAQQLEKESRYETRRQQSAEAIADAYEQAMNADLSYP